MEDFEFYFSIFVEEKHVPPSVYYNTNPDPQIFLQHTRKTGERR
jgi:hypothetical protein